MIMGSVRVSSRNWALAWGSLGNVGVGRGSCAGIGGYLPTPIKRNDLLYLDASLAHRALLVLAVDSKPSVQAGPAEEMTAESDHWIVCELEADVALEITIAGSSVPLVVSISIARARGFFLFILRNRAWAFKL